MIRLREIQSLSVLRPRLKLHSTKEAPELRRVRFFVAFPCICIHSLERRNMIVEGNSRSNIEVRNTGAPDGAELLVRAARIALR